VVKKEVILALESAQGKENVLTAREDLLCYSFNATPDTPGRIPDVVVTPGSTEAVQEVVMIARRFRLPIYSPGFIGTFGHAGDGNLHPTNLTDERDEEEMQRVRRAAEEIFQKALALGGTLSGEHGIGLARRRFLPWELGDPGLDVVRKIKQALDPDNLFNPGKVVALGDEEA